MAVSIREHVFSSGALVDVKECKIIMLKYPGKACRLYFYCILVHHRIRPGRLSDQAVWRKKQADPIERLTACVLEAYTKQNSKKILFKVADQIWRENNRNEMKLHGEYDYECIRNSLSSYPIWLAINLPWPALKNKQRFELFEVFLTSSADQCFIYLFFYFFVVDNLHLLKSFPPQSIRSVGYI